MNNNEKKQNIKPEKKQKKSFLSNFIEIEQPAQKDDTEKPKEVQQESVKAQPQVKQAVKEEKKKTTITKKEETSELTEDEKLLLNTEGGVNLIPRKSVAEVKTAKKKFSLSVSSLVSLVILVGLSLGIVFFNILSKRQLNVAKERLFEREAQLQEYSDKMVNNNDILDRIDLYRYLEKGVFSPKEIIEYIMVITNRSGNVTIRSFDLGNDLSFDMSGRTNDLSVVAKLWYLLGIDENIENINLESVGKSDDGASFSFHGQLNASNFIDN